jgi:hypothetical protein
MAQVVEHLPGKYKALSSIPDTTRKKNPKNQNNNNQNFKPKEKSLVRSQIQKSVFLLLA